MTICHSTLCSMAVAAGLAVGAIDTAGSGPGAVQVITVDTHGKTTDCLSSLKPVIDLIHQYAPHSQVEVLERTQNGDPTGSAYVLVRHLNFMRLETAEARIHTSSEWADALISLEFTGCRLQTNEILLDRTPD